ncbi:MAG: NAD(P)/FAD-dependent oxidoreductase [Pirellulaceae bacterium]|nr:NAD(P)/FAD-dependent oxidoreductase [Pirellulaceae bacterium]
MTPAKEHYAIVGGGMLGLALAWRLSGMGHRVTVLEAADHLGGLADAWKLGDITWDRHYHVTLLSDSYLRAILKELDLDEQMKWVQTRTGFYVDGRLHSMSSSLEFLKFPPLGLIDKFRLGWTIFKASRIKDWKSLEQIPVADWLCRLSGRRTFEKIWLPLLKAKLGDAYKETSAAFIWGTIARMYAARRTGLKKEMFGYLPGGYARLLERFEERLVERGVTLCTNSVVERVTRQEDGKLQVVLNDGSHDSFDRVVITAPANIAARIAPQLEPEEKSRLSAVKYLGIVCASLLTTQLLGPYYVTNITDDWVPYTGVIEMTALVDPQQFGGRSLIYLPKYAAADDPVFTQSDDEIKQSCLTALARMYPHFRAEDVEAIRVSRVRQVFALSTLGYSTRVPPVTTSVPGLSIVTSAQIVNGTLNVNETVRLAEESLPLVTAPLVGRGSPDTVTSHHETHRQLVTRP